VTDAFTHYALVAMPGDMTVAFWSIFPPGTTIDFAIRSSGNSANLGGNIDNSTRDLHHTATTSAS
jgi:hypothetical protein